jgi:acyl carrier protein
MARSRSDLLDVFRTTATEVAEKDLGGVLETSTIAELGIDSLNMMEIIGSLERELRIQIPEEALAGIVTVKDLLNAVEQVLTPRASHAPFEASQTETR